MSHPICNRCHRPILPGSAVDFIGMSVEELVEARIITAEDAPLIVHATCPTDKEENVEGTHDEATHEGGQDLIEVRFTTDEMDLLEQMVAKTRLPMTNTEGLTRAAVLRKLRLTMYGERADG